jgi:hypothetical protein
MLAAHAPTQEPLNKKRSAAAAAIPCCGLVGETEADAGK